MNSASFSDRLSSPNGHLTPADRRVIDYLVQNRETALYASAAEMAAAVGTSDATIIRTVRKLGYRGLDDLRKALATELRQELTLSERMSNELNQAHRSGHSALSAVTGRFRSALDCIDAIDPSEIDFLAAALCAARRIHVFGIGPSGFIAGYFAAQLVRLGFDSRAMTQTGLQFADDLVGLRPRDMVVALAYDRPYPEVSALFDRVAALELRSALITSTGALIPDTRADITLHVARGRTEGFGLHAGTLALLEGLLISVSAIKPDDVKKALDDLNSARRVLSGESMGL